jgi:two-component system CheB/CheR fusion protein
VVSKGKWLRDRNAKSASLAPATAPPKVEPKQNRVAPLVVGIGASAGGLEAFAQLLGKLPSDSGMAFVFVAHLPPGHTRMLPESLGRSTGLIVREARNGLAIEPDHVYVVPPAQTPAMRAGKLFLMPRWEGPHYPIDHFFSSLAMDQGHRAIGVVLSGSSTDGTLGLSAIKAGGGITFAQDSSAQHDAMPRSAIGSGVVDFVLSPDRLATELVRVGGHPYVNGAGNAEGVADDEIDLILSLVRKVSGVDFTQYQSDTLQRRIRRHMVLVKMRDFDEYAAFLRSNIREVEALYQDILFSVTSFFRDPEAFDALETRVFPRLFEDRTREEPIRIWVLGCSSGEEPYSLAIALTEYASKIRSNVPITIYATDLNNAGIEKSRAGLYPRNIEQDVSAERLRRFFVAADGGYRVSKSIRDLCIFARHNVLSDPPFSRMDLISCRNAMIYMEPAFQRKLVPILHYALKPGAFLWLGASETMGSSRELFEAEDAQHEIYSKKSIALRTGPSSALAARHDSQVEPRGETPREPVPEPHPNLQCEADRDLGGRRVPAGVRVHSELDESRPAVRERRPSRDSEADQQIDRLTQELAATRDYLQSVIEQQEAVNEELQSLNEELETSKEEIQSSNEQLTTLNEALHKRNEELSRANNELNDIFRGVPMAILVVWQDLRIRRFTPMAEKLFNLIASDIGRPIGDLQPSLDIHNLSQLLAEVIDTGSVKEQEVQDEHGRWYLLRIWPYRTLDNRIDGAVIVPVDGSGRPSSSH